MTFFEVLSFRSFEIFRLFYPAFFAGMTFSNTFFSFFRCVSFIFPKLVFKDDVFRYFLFVLLRCFFYFSQLSFQQRLISKYILFFLSRCVTYFPLTFFLEMTYSNTFFYFIFLSVSFIFTNLLSRDDFYQTLFFFFISRCFVYPSPRFFQGSVNYFFFKFLSVRLVHSPPPPPPQLFLMMTFLKSHFKNSQATRYFQTGLKTMSSGRRLTKLITNRIWAKSIHHFSFFH